MISAMRFGMIVAGAALAAETHAGFPFENIEILSQTTLSEFPGNPTRGNDCWGYVSPSGREYALMGLVPALAVVEITDPRNPVVVGTIAHQESNWSDIKVYEDHAYVVNETGGGLDVVDLSDVDNGNVTLVQRITEGGLGDVHNLAVDADSGFLYLCLPDVNEGRLVAYDVSDPGAPVLAGSMTAANGGDGIHDGQVVTYAEGPLAGRQIFFGAGEGRGLDIIDVTDKSNMFRISRTIYPMLAYCHQCWLDKTRRYLYVNDESDERTFGITSRTLVFDIADLAAPVLVNTFTSGLPSVDHNLYVRDDLIFEANDASGLRVFNASDPVNPFEIAFFDTFPLNDESGFDGLWSNFPFFPSGNIIGSDRFEGLFVWRLDIPGDATGDGLVTFQDLLAVLAAWGDCPDPPEDCPEDLDGDGRVTFLDILVVLGNWG